MNRRRNNSNSSGRATPRLRGAGALARLSDESLLDLRFCDLDLRLEGSPVESRLRLAHRELGRRGIRFRPHFWFSNEWFTPDGTSGIAVPFYLGHPRLMQMERRQMLDVDGGTERDCLRILRHEMGHAIDNAYALYRRPDWQRMFGRASRPYPNSYRPRPASRHYVLHLTDWYAQSHPSEDFAETFAVWLTPGEAWRTHYVGWPALKKLEYVDQLMRDIGEKEPRLTGRREVEPLRKNRMTLREHYAARRARYSIEHADVIDRHLRRLFSADPAEKDAPPASAFLRRMQGELRRRIARWTGEHQYTVDQVLQRMITRCRRLKLRLTLPEDQAVQEAAVLVAVQTMNDLHAGRGRVLL